MSDHGEMGPEALQFDEAEFADDGSFEATTCAACHREIIEDYFATNGVIVCEPCRMLIENAQHGGSGVGRFVRASALGFLAAIAGFAIYFGILKTTGYQVGLVSILVGLMVGKAVRYGSRGRGGWLYQFLAMFLVYTAVVASHGAVAIPQWLAEVAAKEEAEKAGANAKPPGPGANAKAKAAPAEKPADAPADNDIKPPKTVGEFFGLLGMLALGLIVAVGILYIYPILVGFQSPMGLLIIGFALWEAWKLNRRNRIVFTGPYRVGESPAGGTGAHA
jgi:hypothetical protein